MEDEKQITDLKYSGITRDKKLAWSIVLSTPCSCISFAMILLSAYVFKGNPAVAWNIEVMYDTLLLQRQYQSLSFSFVFYYFPDKSFFRFWASGLMPCSCSQGNLAILTERLYVNILRQGHLNLSVLCPEPDGFKDALFFLFFTIFLLLGFMCLWEVSVHWEQILSPHMHTELL